MFPLGRRFSHLRVPPQSMYPNSEQEGEDEGCVGVWKQSSGGT